LLPVAKKLKTNRGKCNSQFLLFHENSSKPPGPSELWVYEHLGERKSSAWTGTAPVWIAPWESCLCQVAHPGPQFRAPGARMAAWQVAAAA